MSWRYWILAATTFCAACASAPSAEDRAMQQINAFWNAPPERGAEVEAAARAILADPASLRVERKATFLLYGALADQGHCEREIASAEAAITAPDAPVTAWRNALAIQYSCDRDARAAELLDALYARDRTEAADLTGGIVFRVARRTGNVALMTDLVSGAWVVDDPAIDLSDLRLTLMRLHLANGDQAAAIALARTFVDQGANDLGAIAIFLADRTFAPVVATDPNTFSLWPMVDGFVQNSFDIYAEHPDRLSALNALARTLQTAGRAREALALIDDAIARIEAADERDPPYSDLSEELNWTYQVRASLRGALGQEDEALSDLERGAEAGEGGGVNVSQRLNRAGHLLDLGRHEEALAAAEAVRPVDLSPYGRAVRRTLMICAYAELERTDEMRALLVEAEAAGSDAYVQLQAAALCADDFELASRAYISRLNDPLERRDAILDVQGFAGESSIRDWLAQHPVYSRPEVRAAIDEATPIYTFRMRRP